METHYEREYEHIYKHHWWYRAREWCILKVVHELYLNRPLKILEVGCGPGLLLPKLKQLGKIEGIEPAESSFEYDEDISAKVHRISFPYESNKLPSEHYDIILLLDTLEHIQDDEIALLEVNRLLKKGGFAVITVPAFMSLWGPHDLVNHHFRRYTLPEITKLISKAKLTKIWGAYFFGWCYIPVWIVRRIRRISRKNNPDHDFKIPSSWLNAFLIFISCLDFRIAQKSGLPFGTSLIAAAKKDSV